MNLVDIRDVVEQFLRDGRPPVPATQPATGTLSAGSVPNGPSAGPTFGEMVDSITRIIEDTVVTDSWKDNGGSTGVLRELGGRLIITQTPSAHRQIADLLRTLRAGVSKEGAELPPKPAQRLSLSIHDALADGLDRQAR